MQSCARARSALQTQAMSPTQQRKTVAPKTAEEWKDAIENAKWKKGMLAQGFMENLLGDRRNKGDEAPIPLPDFLKKPEPEAPPAPPAVDENGKTVGDIAVEKAAALYDAGHKPLLMVGRKDPWLVPEGPPPALSDVSASTGAYEFSSCRDCRVGCFEGSWAAVCRGGLYEAIPKACTHRVVVDPRGERLMLMLVDGTRSEGAPGRAEKCMKTLAARLNLLKDASVKNVEAAFKGLNKDKCRPAAVIIEQSGRVVVTHCGKTRCGLAVDGSFTFVTPPREEGERSSGGDHEIIVDVLGGPLGERMRVALFSRVLAEHLPVDDVLPAEMDAVQAPGALETRAHEACRLCEHRSWEADREDCGMLDCMSVLLVDVRRVRASDVPGAGSDAETDSDS